MIKTDMPDFTDDIFYETNVGNGEETDENPEIQSSPNGPRLALTTTSEIYGIRWRYQIRWRSNLAIRGEEVRLPNWIPNELGNAKTHLSSLLNSNTRSVGLVSSPVGDYERYPFHWGVLRSLSLGSRCLQSRGTSPGVPACTSDLNRGLGITPVKY